jgi:hypothetical protein
MLPSYRVGQKVLLDGARPNIYKRLSYFLVLGSDPQIIVDGAVDEMDSEPFNYEAH